MKRNPPPIEWVYFCLGVGTSLALLAVGYGISAVSRGLISASGYGIRMLPIFLVSVVLIGAGVGINRRRRVVINANLEFHNHLSEIDNG